MYNYSPADLKCLLATLAYLDLRPVGFGACDGLGIGRLEVRESTGRHGRELG